MGNTDSVPVISQMKSLGQYAVGNSQAALATQQNFAFRNTFPLISQGVSLAHVASGNVKDAIDLQVKFSEDMERVVDTIPVAGHVKGVLAYALGEKEEGIEILKTATRAAGVAAGGMAGMVSLGPVGAVAGGMAAGAVTDGLLTAAEVVRKGGNARPSGFLQAVLSTPSHIDATENTSRINLQQMATVHIQDGFMGYMDGSVIRPRFRRRKRRMVSIRW